MGGGSEAWRRTISDGLADFIVWWLVSDLTDHTAGGTVISYLNEIFSPRVLHVAISSISDLITREL